MTRVSSFRALLALACFASAIVATDAAAQTARTSIYFYTVEVPAAASRRHAETDGPYTHTNAESLAHQAKLKAAAEQKYGTRVNILARSNGRGGCILIYRNSKGLTARMFEPNRKDLEDKFRSRQTTLRLDLVAGPACS